MTAQPVAEILRTLIKELIDRLDGNVDWDGNDLALVSDISYKLGTIATLELDLAVAQTRANAFEGRVIELEGKLRNQPAEEQSNRPEELSPRHQ